MWVSRQGPFFLRISCVRLISDLIESPCTQDSLSLICHFRSEYVSHRVRDGIGASWQAVFFSSSSIMFW